MVGDHVLQLNQVVARRLRVAMPDEHVVPIQRLSRPRTYLSWTATRALEWTLAAWRTVGLLALGIVLGGIGIVIVALIRAVR